jgi:hypothetical protein
VHKFGKVLTGARTLSRRPLTALLDALALKLIVVVDDEKRNGGRSAWPERCGGLNPRVSKALLKRARPEVLRQQARKAAAARWANKSPAEKAAYVPMLNAARVHARMKKAA